MFLLRFTLLHITRNWRIHLVILAALTITIAVFAGLPAYAESTAGASLSQSLGTHLAPGARNLLLSAPPGSYLDEESYRTILAELGGIVQERIILRQVVLQSYQPSEPSPLPEINFYHLWAFEDQEKRISVIEGRLPSDTTGALQAGGEQNIVLEANIGADGARRSGLKVGDTVTAVGAGGPVPLVIVGIIAPVDGSHDMWWGDRRTFDMYVKLLGRSKEIFTLSLHVPPQALDKLFPHREIAWRILLDDNKITPASAQQLQEDISRLQTAFRSQDIQMDSGLPDILGDFRADVSTLQTVLLLLNTQTGLFGMYTIWMITAFLMERSQRDLTILFGRGASRSQIILVFMIEALFLALLAGAVLGPWLAKESIGLVTSTTGNATQELFPPMSRWLAAAAAFCGWLAISLQIFTTSGQNLLWRQRKVEGFPQSVGWHRIYLDMVLLLLGGLSYWQLAQSGGFLTSRLRTTHLTDPFLLLSTTVLLLAVALASLRILPYLLNAITFLTRRTRGLLVNLSLTHLARKPLSPTRVLLLVSLASALSLFATTFYSSLKHSQSILANFQSGADLRVYSPESSATAITLSLSGLPGLRLVSPVFRAQFTRLDSRSVDLIAIDPETFESVAYFLNPSDSQAIGVLTEGSQKKAGESALPGIFSRALLKPQHQVGQTLSLIVAGRPLEFEIRAILDTFPTLGEKFVVADLNALGKLVDLNTLYFSGEAWLAIEGVDANQYHSLLEQPGIKNRLLANANEALQRLQADPIARGVSSSFALSATVLSLFSLTGFLVAHYLAAQGRIYEFGLLRAIGLDSLQSLFMFILEGMLIVFLGILLGAGIGYGLIQITYPGIAQTLTGSLVSNVIQGPVIDWGKYAAFMAALVACFLIGMLTLLISLVRTGIHKVLRLGEE